MARVKGETWNTSYPYVDYSYTQNVAGNYTDISFTFGMHFGSDSIFRTDQRKVNWAANIGTGSYSFGPTGTGPWPQGTVNSEVAYRTGTVRVTHDSAGAGRVVLTFSVFKDYSGAMTLDGSLTLTLPTIPRQPGAAGNPSASGHTDSDPTTATMAWAAPTDVGAGLSQYQLQLSTGSGFTSNAIDNTAAWATSYSASGLEKGTTYYARVRASSSAGFGPYSGTGTFTTGTTVPGTPGTPSAISVGYTSVTLAWGAPSDDGGTGLTGHTVQRATNSGFTAGVVTFTGVGGTSYTVSGLSASTTYYFRVAAVNAVGTGAYSSALTQATTTATAPSAPAAPTFSGVSGTGLTVSWVAPSANGSAITGYTVQYSTSAAFTSPTSISGISAAATSASVTGLAYGTLYYFRVLAINSVGTGTGTGASTTTGTTTPFAPSAPTVSSIGQVTATVSYTEPATGGMPITGYDIQRATDTAFTANAAITPDTASPLVITGLQPGVQHWVRVRAKNANGTGPWSTATSFTTFASAWLRNASNTAWVGAQVYTYNGTTWVLCTTQNES